ncbi:MAG: hypothetical protein GC153_07330 [Alphaproteobacteria bacterium]|nr:hypothetical protein [Alphaproteobacteria bacterium]
MTAIDNAARMKGERRAGRRKVFLYRLTDLARIDKPSRRRAPFRRGRWRDGACAPLPGRTPPGAPPPAIALAGLGPEKAAPGLRRHNLSPLHARLRPC